jgi:hypothetical protein
MYHYTIPLKYDQRSRKFHQPVKSSFRSGHLMGLICQSQHRWFPLARLLSRNKLEALVEVGFFYVVALASAHNYEHFQGKLNNYVG